jgi:hypothetical protein
MGEASYALLIVKGSRVGDVVKLSLVCTDLDNNNFPVIRINATITPCVPGDVHLSMLDR